MVVLARQRGRARGRGGHSSEGWVSRTRFGSTDLAPPLTSGHRPPFRFCPLDLETTFSVAAAFVDGRSSQPTQEEERMKPRCVEDGRTEGRRDESVQLGEEEPVFQTACTTETRRDKVGWRRRRRMERRRDRLPSPCGRNSAEPHGD